MTYMSERPLLVTMALGVVATVAAAAVAQTRAPGPVVSATPAVRGTGTPMAVAKPAPTPDDDARRAAAARLLAASRFRDRQAVLLKDAVRAAESEMAEECLNRAAAGEDMKTCDAIAAPSATMKARLNANASDMLDEVMAASQTIYARRFTATEMDEITRFFRTPVGQHYGQLYPQLLTDVQLRKRAIARRYLTAAAGGAKAR